MTYNIKLTNYINCILATIFIALSSVCHANDSAAASGAGGIQFITEHRIKIAKENIFIGKKFVRKSSSGLPNLENIYPVVVEYEFINESETDVETLVAFPLPLYGYPWEDLVQDRRLRQFELEVDGSPREYATEIKALSGNEDVTSILKELNINIEEFGYFSHDSENNEYQISKLETKEQEYLLSKGIIDKDISPQWKISVVYHWKQNFPANKTVKIKHAYLAIPGFSYGQDIKEFLETQPYLCPEPKLIDTLEKLQAGYGEDKYGIKASILEDNVHYILTTANNWKKPIEKFKLTIEHPIDEYVSFCWDGPIKEISKTQLEVSIENYIPQHELIIYFLRIR